MSSKHYVVFEDDCTNWWSWMLKPGIRHCYVIKLQGDAVMALEKTGAGLSLFTIEDENGVFYIDLCKHIILRDWLGDGYD